ncbi:hypothetical protein PLICRDRAFT_44129 [Plicaturopsis crispa FD-325 SS-3]|nr:hypothetical protein PLICRDRAFT_44129 [Plicaturopsis crispa FD-325 SS-3]
MFSAPSSSYTHNHNADRPPAQSTSTMHSPQFSVAGMAASTAGHSHGPNAWGNSGGGGPLATSLTDTLTPSKAHYQPGYMMSSSQSNPSPQSNQRVEEVPVVPTKAKMNHVLSRGSTSDFGMDSMFQSSRQRQTLADEDAPPTTSINDIPNYSDSTPVPFQTRGSILDKSSSRSNSTRQSRIPPPPQSQPLYVIVFGYPPDKYSVTVEYFKSLGDTTDADQNTEVLNCFRIGYHDPGQAMRAVRKSGEVLGGSWMIGAKWADPALAEAVLSGSTLRSMTSNPSTSNANVSDNAMAVDDQPHPSTGQASAVGTPIKLAPSTSAFRKVGSGERLGTPGQHKMQGVVDTSTVTARGFPPTQSPQKGVLGQVSDLIFGW